MRPRLLALGLLVMAASIASAQRHGPPPSELAQRCGSQIAWQPSLELALARAKETKRPVFWYLATVPRSPMDRKPVVDMYMRAGPFCMPDVVSAINRRFVAVKTAPTREQAKEHRLAPLEFVEPGFLVLKPDGSELARVDKLSTFHELWFVEVLNTALAGAGELGRPSDAALAAGPMNKAEELLLDGLWSAASEAHQPGYSSDLKPYAFGRISARLGDAKSARGQLQASVPSNPEAQVELGLLSLREERWEQAEGELAKVSGGSRADEGRYLRGVALCRLNRQPEAEALWRQIAASPESAWAPKAAAEVERYGPFSRGFEEYGYLQREAVPESIAAIAGTQHARDPKDADWLVRRSVRYLLERQNPDGGYEDSNYDFGGRDSLPDVYVAVTALSALALLEWSAVEPDRVRTAVERAAAYLSDENHVATGNTQERVWAHAYRALFFSRLATAGGPLAEQARAKLKDVTRSLADLQAANGQFGHEYPNPFASATALHALMIAGKAGVPASATTIGSGVAALRKSRGDDGAFAYDYRGGRGARNLDMAAGRMPVCELALVLCGASTEAKLEAAIKTSFEHHGALEKSRKYDDHVPQNHAIGGFFFWYDVYGRCLAIDALTDPARKRASFDRERRLITGIAEIDGRFVDSHELGKPYGTAMALLSLKLASEKNP